MTKGPFKIHTPGDFFVIKQLHVIIGLSKKYCRITFHVYVVKCQKEKEYQGKVIMNEIFFISQTIKIAKENFAMRHTIKIW